MKKIVIALFVFALMFGGVSMTAYAIDCTNDTQLDQVGDWVATLGKQGLEKDQILSKRKAERIAACTKKEAEKAVKEAQKAGNDMKKKLGF